MPLRVPDTVSGDPVDVRRRYRAAVTRHRGKPDVVQHDIDHVRRPVRRLGRHERIPVRHRIPDVDADLSLKPLTHPCTPSATRNTGSTSNDSLTALRAPHPGRVNPSNDRGLSG